MSSSLSLHCEFASKSSAWNGNRIFNQLLPLASVNISHIVMMFCNAYHQLNYRCDDAGAGIVQRSIGDIFDRVAVAKTESATNQKTTFKGSFFEIFNERIYDLLASESLEKTLAARENTSGVYVEGLSEIKVGNLHDVENLLAQGLANRHVASTNMNRTSSRSHALFVLSVKTEENINGLRKVRTSKFTLVDLAGSERQKSTGTWNIFKSFLYLCPLHQC